MKKHIFTTLFCLLEACLLFGGNNLSLWYRQPAANWNEALPLGNGYLGAMVFGDAGREHYIAVNLFPVLAYLLSEVYTMKCLPC